MAHSVENLAEDADDFSVVSYKKSCFTSTVARTKRQWLRTAMPTAILTSNDAKRSFIYRQLHKYRPIATNFSKANFLLFNCDLSIYNTR